jgi:hypothetical protein
MMTGSDNWKIAYPLFLLGMCIIAGLNYILIRQIERRNENRKEE